MERGGSGGCWALSKPGSLMSWALVGSCSIVISHVLLCQIVQSGNASVAVNRRCFYTAPLCGAGAPGSVYPFP